MPKFDVQAPTRVDEVFSLFASTDKTRVDVHSHLSKLEPYKHISGEIEAGDTISYHFSLDRPQDFTIMLSVLSGEADLYLNKGMYNITTTKMYWKKAVNHRSDEIVVRKEEYADLNGPIAFNIGVFGRERAKYSVMVVPEFKNLIAVNFQQLIEMDLNKGEYYYFDFFNRHAKYSTVLFSENSDLEVSALNFDEKDMLSDFLTLIEDESRYVQKFTFHRGDVPRKNLCENAVDVKTHVIVRVIARQANAHINFLIYDAAKPIHVFAERRFTFVAERGDEHVFKMNLGGDYEQVEVDIRLAFGAIEVQLNDFPDGFKNTTVIETPGQKYFTFAIDKNKRSNDIIIFDKLFVKVKAREFSKFSIYAKPKNKFKEISLYETELVYPQKDKDQFFFHFFSDKSMRDITTFSFHIEFVNFYGDKPDLLYLPNSDAIVSENTKFLSMPLIDYVEREKGEFRQVEVKPELISGYFIIKVKASAAKVPIKISISVNNHRNLEVNGLYKGSVPTGQATHSYSMYIPFAGEVRLLAESCSNIAPNHATFTSRHNSTTIYFDEKYSQAFPYISSDETRAHKEKAFKVLAIPIRRALVETPGVFRFDLGRNGRVDQDEIFGLNNHYYLLTEFRPKEKDLFFKDYVKLWDENEKSNQKKVIYQFTDNNRILRVIAALPRFKQQLLMDYPSLKKINMRFYFDLFSEPDFESKLEKCGLAILHEIKTVRKTFERVIDVKSVADNVDEGTAEVMFDKPELDQFSAFDKLNLFSSVSITFYDDDNEQFHVTLNLKFTSVPYFSFVIKNKNKPVATLSNVLFITAFILVILVLLGVFFYITAKGSDELKKDKKYNYVSTDVEASSKLEMSSRSSN